MYDEQRLKMRAMEAAIKIYCCTQGVHGGSPGIFGETISVYPRDVDDREPTLMDFLQELQKQILDSVGF
ncbi:MAG: hypothetical protein M9928_15835 [Anaerolineae bacterium]|nr:hypothetical protein [Anaerolineae bacterium]MCO5195649.1 hypothetical protein [Anaerolineae bacterium]MCO5206507.1 hypothetical protein [Anaerolineae bacterium]